MPGRCDWCPLHRHRAASLAPPPPAIALNQVWLNSCSNRSILSHAAHTFLVICRPCKMAPRSRARQPAAAPQLGLQDLPDEVLVAVFGHLELRARCERAKVFVAYFFCTAGGKAAPSNGLHKDCDRSRGCTASHLPHRHSHRRRPAIPLVSPSAGTAPSPWSAAAGARSSRALSCCTMSLAASMVEGEMQQQRSSALHSVHTLSASGWRHERQVTCNGWR